MSLKIPESPNIIGSEAVLRSPDIVQPVREIPHFSVDFSDLGDSVQQIGQHYQQMVKDQNAVYMNALKVDYNKHMSDFQQQTFNSHKGKDALYLYERYIRPESNKWMANAFGAPKDDGQIRIADKKLQQEFNNWVMSQQPTYISNSAAYGQKQFEAWRTSVWEQQNNTAANMMLTATSNATIENAINLIRSTEYDMNRGLDKKYIEMEIASKVDTGLSGYVSKRAVKDPYGAFLQLDNNPIVSDNLTAGTKENLRSSIRSSYKDLATSEYADYVYSDGTSGSIGLLNRDYIQQVFDAKSEREIDSIIADIKSKGKDKSDATKKQQAGILAQDTLVATNAYLNANTEDERIEAKKNLYVLNPAVGIAVDNAETESLATQQAIDILGSKSDTVLADMTEAVKQSAISEQEKIDEFRADIARKAFGMEDVSGFKNRPAFLKEQYPSDFIITAPTATKKWQKSVTEEDIIAAKNNLLSTGKYTEEEVDAVTRVWKQSNALQRDMDRYKELSARISSGELQAYDADLMGDLAPQMQIQLMYQQQIQGEYLKTKKDLKEIGVDLDDAIQKTGADAQYKNLDISSQNILKRNIITEVNRYKNSSSHGGQLPDSDALQGIIYRVQKNSISPEMNILQNVADRENLSAENMTDEQRYSLAVYNTVSSSYNTPAKRGLKDQIKRAESDVDKLSRDEGLSVAERLFIIANKDDFVRMLQAGDIKGMATFIGLAKQGGF